MRVKLDRDRNNIFLIPDSYLLKDRVRIMCIYENNSILSQEEYQMMGPRKIKMLREVPPTSIIYAKVSEIKLGNKLIGR